IGDAAFQLGDIYEGKNYKQYKRSALYYERCFQWKSHLGHEARIRAARIYDKQLMDRSKAKELYTDVTTHDTDSKRIEEAKKRLPELPTRKEPPALLPRAREAPLQFHLGAQPKLQVALAGSAGFLPKLMSQRRDQFARHVGTSRADRGRGQGDHGRRYGAMDK